MERPPIKTNQTGSHYLPVATSTTLRQGGQRRLSEVARVDPQWADAATLVSWDGPDGRESTATDTPTAEVAKLAARFGGEVPGLTVARPTLEDIYLAMISKESQ